MQGRPTITSLESNDTISFHGYEIGLDILSEQLNSFMFHQVISKVVIKTLFVPQIEMYILIPTLHSGIFLLQFNLLQFWEKMK